MTIRQLGDAVPRVDPSAWIASMAQLIGNVSVGACARIWPGVVLRSDFGVIDAGEGASVQDNTVVHPGSGQPTQIGRDCVVGHNFHLEGVEIDDDVPVGSGAVLLQGASVRTGGAVAAGAPLPNGVEVPTGQRAQGIPARLVPVDADIARVRADAAHSRELARRYANDLRPIGHA